MGGQGYGARSGLDIQKVAVPEPSTLRLVSVGFGLAGILAKRRK